MRTHPIDLRAAVALLPLLGLGLLGCGPAQSECPPGGSCTVSCERDSDCAAGQVCTTAGQPLAGTCALPSLDCADLQEEACTATPGCVAIYSIPPCTAAGCGSVFDHCVTVATEPTCGDGELYIDDRCQLSCGSSEQCGDNELCSVELDGQCRNSCPDNPAGGACACLGICQPTTIGPMPEPVPPTTECQGLGEDECNDRSDCQANYCSPCPDGAQCLCDGFAGCSDLPPPG